MPATIVAAILGFVSYLGFLSSNGAQETGPVIAGRPVVWLVLQLFALAAVAATVAVAIGRHRARTQLSRRHRIHLGALILAGALFTPWALYWGLLIP